MALTKTDRDEIARIARKEIKDFMAKPQFKNEVQKVVADEIKKGRNTNSRKMNNMRVKHLYHTHQQRKVVEKKN